MSAQEKAKEIYKKMWDQFPAQSAIQFDLHPFVKACAIIAVDEIINANPYYFYPGRKVTRVEDHSTKDFWNDVKKQIELL